MALRRLTREIADVQKSTENTTAAPLSESDMFKWGATIVGPDDTPYAGGIFKLTLDFPADYPMKPPVVKFKTPVYHPSVNENGEICLDILKNEWTPNLTVLNILSAVRSLLQDPTANDHPLMAAIAEEAKGNWELFCSKAKDLTAKHAK